jgi:hypothetical protein
MLYFANMLSQNQAFGLCIILAGGLLIIVLKIIVKGSAGI